MTRAGRGVSAGAEGVAKPGSAAAVLRNGNKTKPVCHTSPHGSRVPAAARGHPCADDGAWPTLRIDDPDRRSRPGLRPGDRGARSTGRARSCGPASPGSTPAPASPRSSATTTPGFWRIAPADHDATVEPPLPVRPGARVDLDHAHRRRAGHRLHARPRREPRPRPPRRSASRARSTCRTRTRPPVRLRLDRPLGAPASTATSWRSPAPTACGCARPVDHHGENMRTVGRLHRPRRRPGALRPRLATEPPRLRRRRSTPRMRSNGRSAFWTEWAETQQLRRRLRRRRPRVPRRAQGPDLRPHRRHRRRADHLAARGDRRRAATGTTATAGCATPPTPCWPSSSRATSTRPWPGATGCCAPSPASPRRHPDHVRRRRRAAPHRARAALARRPSRLDPGAHRQRRPRPVPARRVRRGHGRPPPGPRVPASTPTATRGSCRRCWSTSSPTAGANPTTGCGRSGASAQHFTHSKVMAWVAVDRAVQRRRGLRARRPGRRLASAARRDPGRDPDQGGRRSGRVHPGLRLRPPRRQPAARAPRRVPARRRRAGRGHRRRHRRGADGRRLPAPLPDRVRRRRPRGRGGRVPAVLVLAGPGVGAAGPGRRGDRAVRAAAGPAQRRRPAVRGGRPPRRLAARQHAPGVQPPRHRQHRHGAVRGLRRRRPPPGRADADPRVTRGCRRSARAGAGCGTRRRRRCGRRTRR